MASQSVDELTNYVALSAFVAAGAGALEAAAGALAAAAGAAGALEDAVSLEVDALFDLSPADPVAALAGALE